MISSKCHLQGQLLILIKCPELLGQICWTVKQKSLLWAADLSWPAGKGHRFVKYLNNGAEFAFQIPLRQDPE